MIEKPIQDAVRAYALEQIGAAYVMGATAQRCTPSMRRALANGRSSDYADQITGSCPVLSGRKSSCEGCGYAGRLAFDCAQLSKYAAKAGGIELPSGSNSQWTKVNWGKRGEIAGMPMDVVCFVYHEKAGKMSHVGVYLGDGTVADARGHADGVKHQPVTDYPWTHYAIPAEIASEAQLDAVIHPTYGQACRRTLRKGSKGEDVVYLQQLLNAKRDGAVIDEDGIFGSATQALVEAFQREHGLVVDGIVGPLTWAALEREALAEEEQPEGDDAAATEKSPEDWQGMSAEEKIEVLRVRVDLLAEKLEKALFGAGGAAVG